MDGQTVLAIACDWRMRRLIRANLEAEGLEVREAVSGLHGLQLARERQPDLILLDIESSEVDAGHLLGVLNGQFAGQQVPVVAMSAEPLARHLRHHEHLVGCLQKPFSVVHLLEQVQQALGSASRGKFAS